MLDREAKTGSVDVVIDTTSVDTGFDVFNGHIQGEDFLSTEKFPSATFKSTKVRFEGDKPVAVEGDLIEAHVLDFFDDRRSDVGLAADAADADTDLARFGLCRADQVGIALIR